MKGCMDHIASEMLEAQYDWATGFLNGEEKGKPVGMASELADMVILIAHAAYIAGIDLDKALNEKVRWCNENPK